MLRRIWPFCLVLLFTTGAQGSDTLTARALKPGGGELKYEEPKFLAGSIYARDSNRLLFKFKRVANHSGSTLRVQRDYTYPDGKLAARERVIYEGDALVFFALDEVQVGAGGTAAIRRVANNPAEGSIEFHYRSEPGSRPKASTEAMRENTLIGDMVGPFLVSHWDLIQRGEKVKCRYIVVPRKETVGFTFVRDSGSTQQDPGLLVVKMEPTSPFISALVDPLFFTVEKAPPHRILKYVGRTTPKVDAGGKWKDLDAVTVFDWDSAPDGH